MMRRIVLAALLCVLVALGTWKLLEDDRKASIVSIVALDERAALIVRLHGDDRFSLTRIDDRGAAAWMRDVRGQPLLEQPVFVSEHAIIARFIREDQLVALAVGLDGEGRWELVLGPHDLVVAHGFAVDDKIIQVTETSSDVRVHFIDAQTGNRTASQVLPRDGLWSHRIAESIVLLHGATTTHLIDGKAGTVRRLAFAPRCAAGPWLISASHDDGLTVSRTSTRELMPVAWGHVPLADGSLRACSRFGELTILVIGHAREERAKTTIAALGDDGRLRWLRELDGPAMALDTLPSDIPRFLPLILLPYGRDDYELVTIDLESGRAHSRTTLAKPPLHAFLHDSQWMVGGGFASWLATIDGATGDFASVVESNEVSLAFSGAQVAGKRVWLFRGGYEPVDEPHVVVLDATTLVARGRSFLSLENVRDVWLRRTTRE